MGDGIAEGLEILVGRLELGGPLKNALLQLLVELSDLLLRPPALGIRPVEGGRDSEDHHAQQSDARSRHEPQSELGAIKIRALAPQPHPPQRYGKQEGDRRSVGGPQRRPCAGSQQRP